MHDTSSVLSWLRRLPESTRTIVVTLILSLASAGMAVGFLFLTNQFFSWTFEFFATRSLTFFLAASFATIMGTSLAVGLLLGHISPEAAGSGIPQLKAVYWMELGYVQIKPVLVKFAAGVLSIGGGTSLGREGPTVYMGGGLSSWLSGFLGFSKRERRNPSLIGASAGLAAAFNTPLAAITFVLEEIVGDLSSRSIGRVLFSSIIGAFTVYALVGRQPAFAVPSVEAVSWIQYALAPIVALVAALLGVAFQKQTLALRTRVKRQRRAPRWALPLVGGFATWCIGAAVFAATGKLGVFSLGYQDLSSVLRNDCVWWIAGILALGKLAATIASYSFGGCGGIFSPLLFIGGLSGYFIGNLFDLWLPLASSDLIVLSAVGMSCCLGTVVKAPLSAMLIVFEMTHQFAMVPALLIGMAVSMLVSRISGPENFYDAILVQDGHELHRIKPPLDLSGWQSLPVRTIASRKPVFLAMLTRDAMRATLEEHPFERFPVTENGRLVGIATRKAIEAAIAHDGMPELLPAMTCEVDETIRDVAGRFVGSSHEIAVVMEGEKAIGLLTLHDILRAQAEATGS